LTRIWCALFSRDRFVNLAELRERLKGSVFRKLNDLPEVREIFAQFEVAEMNTSCSMAANGSLPERGEMVITEGHTS